MKSIIVATILAAASFALANTHMSHNYMAALGDISLNNACVTEDTVRTIHPTRTCATELRERTVEGVGDGSASYTEWYCPRYHMASLEYSRHFVRRVCIDHRKIGHGETESIQCIAYGQQAEFLPEVIQVRVWEDLGEASTWPGTTKSFRFPSCD